MSATTGSYIDENTFHADVEYIETLWRRMPVGALDMPLIDIGRGEPVVFVPILEHLEFVYARQIHTLSESRRVIMYRRHETRTRPIGLVERAEELRRVLDSLGLAYVDLVAHGDAAMVLFEFAARYPYYCRSLIIIAQGADYQIAPHPLIWLLHELFVRLPVEYFLPAWFLRRIVINYIVARDPASNASSICSLPRHLIEEQFRKIALWPFVYKFSVLPVIHNYDIRKRLGQLSMPILLINRADDVLAPEPKTRWLAENLPNCAGYHVVSGGERFFMYSQTGIVTQLIEKFLTMEDAIKRATWKAGEHEVGEYEVDKRRQSDPTAGDYVTDELHCQVRNIVGATLVVARGGVALPPLVLAGLTHIVSIIVSIFEDYIHNLLSSSIQKYKKGNQA